MNAQNPHAMRRYDAYMVQKETTVKWSQNIRLLLNLQLVLIFHLQSFPLSKVDDINGDVCS